MKTLRAAYIQQSCSDNLKHNVTRSIDGIQKAAAKGAQLVVLQELHRSLYFCQTENVNNFDLAEPIPGPTTELFGKTAKENNVVLVTSLFEKRAPGIYHNTAVVFDRDGSIAGTYRKMHIPDDPLFYEKFYFTPGDLGFKPIETSIGSLGVLICWDQWYPEAARLMALGGAEILIYPTAIGWDPNDPDVEINRQLAAWITIQRSHAIANGIPVISVNRTGFEATPTTKESGSEAKGICFWGNSFAAGPQGEIITQSSADQEEVAVFDLDMERSENVRRIWPYFRDRRIDSYEPILKRFGK